MLLYYHNWLQYITENLYSSVNKTKREDDEIPYSSVNKEKKLSTVDQPETGDKHVAGPGTHIT
jgi:hypothetical protein